MESDHARGWDTETILEQQYLKQLDAARILRAATRIMKVGIRGTASREELLVTSISPCRIRQVRRSDILAGFSHDPLSITITAVPAAFYDSTIDISSWQDNGSAETTSRKAIGDQ